MDQQEKERNYALAEKLLSEQNFGVAVFSGAIATVLVAGIYAVVTMASGGYAYSFMAAGIGLAIGFVMQYLGRGIETKFAVVASIYAVLGCMLGNLFTEIMYVARAEALSPSDVLSGISSKDLPRWIFASFQFADLIFWIVAMAGAAYLVKRPLSREEGLALHMYQMKGSAISGPRAL